MYWNNKINSELRKVISGKLKLKDYEKDTLHGKYLPVKTCHVI
jgi:hypothetical protein